MKFRAGVLRTAIFGAAVLAGAWPAHADKIKHPTVIFAGLDKITGRIITFDVAVDETVQFGSIQITPRVCYTRPATEAPQTTTFVEVDDIAASGEVKRIFSGWMFAASPGLHGVEHPVYDIWLKDCRGGTEVIVTPPESADLRDDDAPKQAAPARPRQQARPVTPQPLPPGFGAPIEVGPPPGAGRPVAQPQVPYQPAQQQPRSLPSARDAPIGMSPPANIPNAR